MDTGSIVSASMTLSTVKVQQSAGIAIARKVMDTQEAQMAALMDMMKGAMPDLGQKIDVRA